MHLLLDAERVDVAEGDVPGVGPVGVLGPGRREEGGEEDEDAEGGGRRHLHFQPLSSTRANSYHRRGCPLCPPLSKSDERAVE